jgi:RNA polymerase sigma-70 factor, ECF subfamily
MNNDPKTEQFVQLLMANDQGLFAYVFSLMLNAEDARDVMQEAAVSMWKHFNEYDPSRPFFPWASRFAYFTILSYRKRKPNVHSFLSDLTVQALADEYPTQQLELDARVTALVACMDKLPVPARKLLEQRYQGGQNIQEIARRTGRSANTLYKVFEKLRHELLVCVTRAIAAEGTP